MRKLAPTIYIVLFFAFFLINCKKDELTVIGPTQSSDTNIPDTAGYSCQAHNLNYVVDDSAYTLNLPGDSSFCACDTVNFNLVSGGLSVDTWNWLPSGTSTSSEMIIGAIGADTIILQITFTDSLAPSMVNDTVIINWVTCS